MDYPVIIGGDTVGRLSVRTEGLFTVFEAEISRRVDMPRLWVLGGGKAGYLGVMQPWSGGMYLRKKLSKSAMKGFPTQIEYAGDRAGGHETAPQPSACPQQPEVRAEPPAPQPADVGEGGLLWFASPSGVLTAFDGEHSLTAIPARLRRPFEGADIRRICGRDYIVFRKY